MVNNIRNFARSSGDSGCCGWDTRAPFPFGQRAIDLVLKNGKSGWQLGSFFSLADATDRSKKLFCFTFF
jgi:hypothetical protein